MRHEFVENIPDHLEVGTIYVSLTYDLAVHLCACGCKNEVVTPLSPAHWALTYDGDSVSLHPSIGNWSFPCRSHYFLRKGAIEWAYRYSEQEIRETRAKDELAIRERYSDSISPVEQIEELETKAEKDEGWVARFWRWLRG